MKIRMRNLICLLTAFVFISCNNNSNTNNTNLPKVKIGTYEILHHFSEPVTGDSDYGLTICNGQLYAVLGGLKDPAVFTYDILKPQARFDKLHGSVNHQGTIYNVQHGLVNCGDRVIGITQSGGKNDLGTIYTVNPVNGKVMVEYDFNNDDEIVSPGSLPFYNGDSLLFGLALGAESGDVKIYQYNLALKKITRIFHEINPIVGRESSRTRYVFGPDRNIYVSDRVSGEKDLGSVYRLSKNFEKKEMLCSFDSTASGPSGCPVFIKGRIYGAAGEGGIKDNGAVYIMKNDGSDFKVLAKFDRKNGHMPNNIIQASNGKLYGTCFSGGKFTDGTLFSLNTDGSDFKILHHYSEEKGKIPDGDIIEIDGGIYGITRSGGKNNAGVLYKFQAF